MKGSVAREDTLSSSADTSGIGTETSAVASAQRTLLAHVAFHYVESRTRYLAEIVQNFASYELDRVEVVIDTNSERVAAFLATCVCPPHVTVRAHVHTTLSHPFGLTWMHRRSMPQRHREFDLFMYLEDDILVPWPAVRAWLADTEALYEQGCLRGFLRVERNLKDQLVATDWMTRLRNPLFRDIGGVRYIHPRYPYQAFWLATASQLDDFMKLPIWSQGGLHPRSKLRLDQPAWWDSPESMRERAAYGMQYARGGSHQVLLPLATDGQVDPDCFVYHLPNNYGLQAVCPLARLWVDDLLRGRSVPAQSLAAVFVQARDRLEDLARNGMDNARALARRLPRLHSAMRFARRAALSGAGELEPMPLDARSEPIQADASALEAPRATLV